MPNQNRARINERIRASRCVLIDADGKNRGVTSMRDALSIAEGQNLDLVEVGGSAEQPTCRVMDYGKYRYEQEKKAKRNRKNAQKDVKQMKFRVNIGEGDLKHKLANVSKFLNDGHKVVLTVMYRGREMSHTELGINLLEHIADLLAEDGHVVSKPKVVGRDATMTIAPNTGKNK